MVLPFSTSADSLLWVSDGYSDPSRLAHSSPPESLGEVWLALTAHLGAKGLSAWMFFALLKADSRR